MTHTVSSVAIFRLKLHVTPTQSSNGMSFSLDDCDAMADAGTVAVAAPAPSGRQEAKPRDPNLCRILNCKYKKIAKAAFCSLHRRIMDQIDVQSKSMEDEAMWQLVRNDPEKLTAELEERLRTNPQLLKSHSRAPPLDFTVMRERHFTKTSTKDESWLAKFDRVACGAYFKLHRNWDE